MTRKIPHSTFAIDPETGAKLTQLANALTLGNRSLLLRQLISERFSKWTKAQRLDLDKEMKGSDNRAAISGGMEDMEVSK